jgi:diguanylate cyclase (GGDEF)-like protein
MLQCLDDQGRGHGREWASEEAGLTTGVGLLTVLEGRHGGAMKYCQNEVAVGCEQVLGWGAEVVRPTPVAGDIGRPGLVAKQSTPAHQDLEKRVRERTEALAAANQELIAANAALRSEIKERKRIEEELRLLAVTDPLTGASNRRYFMDRAREELARSLRYGQPLHLLYMDLDHFKSVNDRYGHDAGDVVLTAVVATCRTTLRATDLFGRLGGEEFAALLIQTDSRAARQTAERLRKAIAKTSVPCGQATVGVTASIGMAGLDGPQESLETLLKRADTALYAAKRGGRNRLCRR